MKKLLFVLPALLQVFFSCKKEISNQSILSSQKNESVSSSSAIIATPSPYWDSVFTRYGNGWTGGDIAYSYKLNDGRSVWLFGDSFLDTVYPSRKRPVNGFIHSVFTTTTGLGYNFTTIVGGTLQNPVTLFPAPDTIQYWANCAYTNTAGKKLYVQLVTIKPTGTGGLFGFETIGNATGVMSLPDFKLEKIVTTNNSGKIDWSSNTYVEGNYVYLYGVESTKYNKFVHVCRTNRNTPFKNYEYYNGTSWVKDSAQSTRIHNGVSEQFSFFKHNGKYYLLSQGNLLDDDIFIWDAASPAGPFTGKRHVYKTPQYGGNIITYNATVHYEFTEGDKLLVGYCTNSNDGRDLFRNADVYRPYFITVENWQ
jgi:hypothetical protein